MTSTPLQDIPDIEDVHLAHARIRQQVRVTPVLNDPGLDAELACRLYCKCENLQRAGAFKFRGASNAVLLLEEKGNAGDLATHSSGNHGAALALAARLAGQTAHVVMPENSSSIKIAAVRSLGGQVHFCKPTHESRKAGLEKLVAEGKTAVHPYDDAAIIAGQGTAALELEQEVPSLEQIITPLGGGGLVSGTAIATRSWGVDVFAVEPEGAADTVLSLEQGQIVETYTPDTIADGLRAIVGQRNFHVIRQHVKQVLTVSDDEIREAMILFWRYLRILIEPSSATVIAAIRRHPEIFSGKKVGAILSGGNIHPADWVALTGYQPPK
ncbi:MAG: threonine/serine dehydratase [Xanthomonadales bacterium]|jgi:threonine dehydratase|nr:threonine/serine dehydratase [Xanthomonadales bacterium]